MHTVRVEEARLGSIPVEVDRPSSLLDSHHEEDVGGDNLGTVLDSLLQP